MNIENIIKMLDNNVLAWIPVTIIGFGALKLGHMGLKVINKILGIIFSLLTLAIFAVKILGPSYIFKLLNL